MKLKKVDYDPKSPHGAVQSCLTAKIEASKPKDQGGVPGIGSQSCCSFIEAWVGEKPYRVVGNSRNKVAFQKKGADPSAACAHGELQALWQLYEDAGDIGFTILSMYIEMSPCPKCTSALKNLLLEGVEIMYSFDYPNEVEAWKAAARALCG